MYRLLELIIKNSRQNKLLNINDIEIIVKNLLEIYDVDEYLKNIRYTNSKTLYVGAYDSIKKELIFNYKKILSVILNIKKESFFKVYDNYILYFNIVILQIIMHEFEHIYQQKVIYNIDNEYSEFLKKFLYIQDTISKKYYEICPEERTAEILSYEKINNSMEYMSDFNIEIKDIINTDYIQRTIRGYKYYNDKFIVPTYEYLKYCDMTIDFDFFNKIKELNERLLYGLEVSNEEILPIKKKVYLKMKKYFQNRIIIENNRGD